MAALFAAAADAGLAVAGHFPTGVDPADKRFAALFSLEHGNQLHWRCQQRNGACAGLLKTLARRRTACVPTDVAAAAQDAQLGLQPVAEATALAHATTPVALLRRTYRALHRAGDSAGTHADQARDLVDALRLTRAAHRAVITVPAAVFGLGHRNGHIGPGYDTDMVMLEANPLDDIAAVRQIVGVMRGDRVFAPADLVAMRGFARDQAGDPAVNARACWPSIAG